VNSASAATTCASTTAIDFVQYAALPVSCPSSAPFHAENP